MGDVCVGGYGVGTDEDRVAALTGIPRVRLPNDEWRRQKVEQHIGKRRNDRNLWSSWLRHVGRVHSRKSSMPNPACRHLARYMYLSSYHSLSTRTVGDFPCSPSFLVIVTAKNVLSRFSGTHASPTEQKRIMNIAIMFTLSLIKSFHLRTYDHLFPISPTKSSTASP